MAAVQHFNDELSSNYSLDSEKSWEEEQDQSLSDFDIEEDCTIEDDDDSVRKEDDGINFIEEDDDNNFSIEEEIYGDNDHDQGNEDDSAEMVLSSDEEDGDGYEEQYSITDDDGDDDEHYDDSGNDNDNDEGNNDGDQSDYYEEVIDDISRDETADEIEEENQFLKSNSSIDFSIEEESILMTEEEDKEIGGSFYSSNQCFLSPERNYHSVSSKKSIENNNVMRTPPRSVVVRSPPTIMKKEGGNRSKSKISSYDNDKRKRKQKKHQEKYSIIENAEQRRGRGSSSPLLNKENMNSKEESMMTMMPSPPKKQSKIQNYDNRKMKKILKTKKKSSFQQDSENKNKNRNADLINNNIFREADDEAILCGSTTKEKLNRQNRKGVGVSSKNTNCNENIKKQETMMMDANGKVNTEGAPSKPSWFYNNDVERREVEMQELRTKYAKLERRIHMSDVQRVSELADIEEETMKKMKEYRDDKPFSKGTGEKGKGRGHVMNNRSNDEDNNDNDYFTVRIKRANKEKKKMIENQTIQNQGLALTIRQSNQKLRTRCYKLKQGINKLEQENQKLQDNNSYHLDYYKFYNNILTKEIKISTGQYKHLVESAPRQQQMISIMEDSVSQIEKYGEMERKTKALYIEWTMKMVNIIQQRNNNKTKDINGGGGCYDSCDLKMLDTINEAINETVMKFGGANHDSNDNHDNNNVKNYDIDDESNESFSKIANSNSNIKKGTKQRDTPTQLHKKQIRNGSSTSLMNTSERSNSNSNSFHRRSISGNDIMHKNNNASPSRFYETPEKNSRHSRRSRSYSVVSNEYCSPSTSARTVATTPSSFVVQRNHYRQKKDTDSYSASSTASQSWSGTESIDNNTLSYGNY